MKRIHLTPLFLVIFLTMLSLNGGEFKGVIIQNNDSGNRIVLLGSDESFLFNDLDNPEVTIYDKTNSIEGTYSIRSCSNNFIIQENQCLLRGYDRITGEGIYFLAIGKYFNTPALETAILMYPDSDYVCEEPNIIWLDHKILAEKLGVDQNGNFYLLGLLEAEKPATDELNPTDRQNSTDEQKQTDGQKLSNWQDVTGDCPLLHKFSPDGNLVFSAFIKNIKPDPERIARISTKPILPSSSFAVSPDGEVWILWDSIESKTTGDSSSEARLYHVDLTGKVIEVEPDLPESGYTFTGLLKNSDSGEVLFVWEDIGPGTEVNTILTTPDGTIVAKRCCSGRIISISEDLLITKAHKMGLGIRKNALIMYSRD